MNCPIKFAIRTIKVVKCPMDFGCGYDAVCLGARPHLGLGAAVVVVGAGPMLWSDRPNLICRPTVLGVGPGQSHAPAGAAQLRGAQGMG